MKYSSDDVVFTVNGMAISQWANGGIVNVPSMPTMSEDAQFQSLVAIAEKYGANIITVGIDCDMNSSLMLRLVQSGKFIIRQQFEPESIQLDANPAKLTGPRNRWGNLK